MNAELRREVARWLRYAQEDLREARRLVERPETVPRHPAWLAQQAAENTMEEAQGAVEDASRLVTAAQSNLDTRMDLE